LEKICKKRGGQLRNEEKNGTMSPNPKGWSRLRRIRDMIGVGKGPCRGTVGGLEVQPHGDPPRKNCKTGRGRFVVWMTPVIVIAESHHGHRGNSHGWGRWIGMGRTWFATFSPIPDTPARRTLVLSQLHHIAGARPWSTNRDTTHGKARRLMTGDR